MFGRRHKTRQELVRSEFGDSMIHFRQAAVHAAGGVGAAVGPMSVRAKDLSGRARDFSGRTTDLSGRARDLSDRAKMQVIVTRARMAPTAGRLSQSATMRASSTWDSTMAAFAPIALAAREGAAKANAIEAKNIKKTRKVIETQTTESHSTRNIAALIACGAAMGAAGALVARRRNRAKWAEYEPSSLESDASSLLDPNSTATTSMSRPGEVGMVKKASDMTKSAVGSVRSKIQDAKSSRHGLDADTTSDLTDDARSTMKHANEKANEGASHFSGTTEGKLNSSEAEDMMRSKNGRR